MADLRPRASGWASNSLVTSLRKVTLGLIAAWQIVMIVAASVSLGWSAWPLMFLHAILAILATLAVTRFQRIPVWPMPLAMALLGLLGYVASGDLTSVLVFAACWQINFASCAFGLILLSPIVIPTVLAVAVSISATLSVALPDWGLDLPVTIVITQLSIVLALRYGLPALFALARHTEEEERLSAAAVERAEIAHRTGLQIAEEARVLHDTAVNTLGAIANGGGAIADPERVRRQCANDLIVLEQLQREQAEPPPGGGALLAALGASWIPVCRRGASDEQIATAVSQEDPKGVAGYAGAVRETIQNAAKHAGVEIIEVSVTLQPGNLTIEVRDRGVGFDLAAARQRGLRHSVRERADEHGFSATISSTPGQGTRAVLTLPLGADVARAASAEESSVSVEETIRKLRQRAALLWAAGVTAVSVVLSATNPANYTLSTVIMIAMMVGVCVWARFASGDDRGGWMIAALTLAPSLIFLAAATTTDFGSSQALHWQALAPTAAFVLLLSRGRLRRGIWWAATLWVLTAVAIMFLGLPATVDAQAIVAVAAAVGLGFAVVWSGFQSAVARLSFDAAAAERRIFWANLETSAAQAAQRTYLHWISTGLETTMQLMRDIVERRRNAQRVETREACASEELYLRQVIQVGPELVHLGRGVFPAMRRAHDRGIELTLRLGDQDAMDRATADAIAHKITAVIEDASARDRVTGSLFPVRSGLQLTLIRIPGSPDPGSAPLEAKAAAPITAQFLFPVAVAGRLSEPKRHSRITDPQTEVISG